MQVLPVYSEQKYQIVDFCPYYFHYPLNCNSMVDTEPVVHYPYPASYQKNCKNIGLSFTERSGALRKRKGTTAEVYKHLQFEVETPQ